MQCELVDISAIIATRDRKDILQKSLETLAHQTHCPKEVIIIDGSNPIYPNESVMPYFQTFRWLKADSLGAAAQRNQGVSLASYPYVLFMDDDVYLQPDVIRKLWKGITTLPTAGAVSSMITNQQYSAPGFITRMMYWIMTGRRNGSFAGKLIGPAWNLLPEDSSELPDYVSCDWVNTTCTLYKKSAMPSPVFPAHFSGYSLMEDVTLSVIIGRNFKLYNARTARIFHDSQPGSHKNSLRELSRMQLVNRYYVMTKILKKTSFRDKFKLLLLEIFGVVSSSTSVKGIKALPEVLTGKFQGVRELLKLR